MTTSCRLGVRLLLGRLGVLHTHWRGVTHLTSGTLPRIKTVHHPARVEDSTLLPWCDVHIPEIPYCDYVWDQLPRHSHLPGLVCGVTGRTLLHGQIRDESLRVSASLRALGLCKGDVVGVLLPNCIEYPLIVQGALHSGLVITPMNPAYTVSEICRQMAASGATILISHIDIWDKVTETLSRMPGVHTSVCIGGGGGREGVMGWEDLLRLSSDPDPVQVEVDVKRDLAVLPFSSGTTGAPKGVMLTQHNLVANNVTVISNDAEFLYRASGMFQEVTLGVLPMFHIFGLNVTMSGFLHMGGKNVVVPSFNPVQFVKLMEEHRPSLLHLVPPLASFLADSPLVTTEHLASLRQVNVGAAPSGTNLIEKFYRKAPSYVHWKEGWGLTEVAGAGTGIARAYGGLTSGSVNQLLPNMRLQIRDTRTDQALGPMERGEIVVQGPQCMLGYRNNQTANMETFDSEGWLRTGDIGYYTERGVIYIVDRMKELIKVKGLQVAPAELEDVLRGLAGVLDVGVIGVQDDRAGQVPRAYIVREEGLTKLQVMDFMKVEVSEHKQLMGGVEFVQAIPKSAAGKILRKELQTFYQNTLDKSVGPGH